MDADFSKYSDFLAAKKSKPLDIEVASLYLIERNDMYSQLSAMSRIVQVFSRAREEFSNDVRKLEFAIPDSSGMQQDFLQSELIDHYWLSTYHEAAIGMSHVSLLAPTFESLFHELFLNIGKVFGMSSLVASSHRRKLNQDRIWDCYYFSEGGKKGKKNISSGIRELLIDSDFVQFLPDNATALLDALFCFRNKVFHNGFDWPEEEVETFTELIESSGWPRGWFRCATSNDSPWIYYISSDFQKLCQSLVYETYQGAGKYYNKYLNRKNGI